MCFPREPELSTKGVAIAVSDGISSSKVSHLASESAIKGFLTDYYCTSDAWSVKHSGQRVIESINAWLYAQTQRGQGRFDKDQGYVCTFSAVVFRSNTAHLFHIGDSRIYKIHQQSVEQLTTDHCSHISADESYLSRALGVASGVEIDYLEMTTQVGDIFLLATDGLFEFLDASFIAKTVNDQIDDLHSAAQVLIKRALDLGSKDNLTVVIACIEELPDRGLHELPKLVTDLPLPPSLGIRAQFDGFKIIRELHASGRSRIYLATDLTSNATVVLKMPCIEFQNDSGYLERLLMEEWIARRINNDHVLKIFPMQRRKNYLYIALEYIKGQNLSQWMRDHPSPKLNEVRDIIEQVAKGLTAFHRLEILHQDLRPENIMIDDLGVVRVIDFGSARVANLAELATEEEKLAIQGTLQYTAPEYFLGLGGSVNSDIFSLGCIAYEMLTTRLPYGLAIPKIRKHADLRRLRYASVRSNRAEIPSWIDSAIRRAVHTEPTRRQRDCLEFAWDLCHPNNDFLSEQMPPLIQRDPVKFWKSISLILLLLLITSCWHLAIFHN